MIKNKPTLEEAIALARQAHEGQVDKAGAPYIEHPLRMMESVEGEDAKIVAVLHDTVEDTFVTFDSLRDAGYPEHVIEAIEGVTKRDDEHGDEGYEKFIARAALNPLSRQIKIADLQDNMDLSRIAEPTEKDYKRLQKYQRAINYLNHLS